MGAARRSLGRLGLITAVLATVLIGAWRLRDLMFPGPVARGFAAYREGDWKGAANLAQERLREAKTDPQARRLLARASARQDRLAEARSLYASIPASNLEAEDHYLLGLTLAQAGQFDPAQLAWRTALAARPDHAEALHQMAQLNFQRGQTVEGLETARRLARLPGWEVRGAMLLAMFLASDNKPGPATEALTGALRREPAARLMPNVPFSAQKLLARTLLQQGLSGRALPYVDQILAAGPDREASWLQSRILLLEHDPARAASALAHSAEYRAEFPMEPEPSPYVGEGRCSACHREIQQQFLASRHARTLRRGNELANLTLPEHDLADPTDPTVSHRWTRTGREVSLETRVGDKISRAVVDYALGALDRYTSFIGRDEQGKARTLRLSHYQSRGDTGWDRTKNLHARPGVAEDFLGAPFESVEGPGECLSCHATTTRAAIEGTGPEASDGAIGCERCHGPGAHHLTAIETRFTDPMIAAPAHSPARGVQQLCGSCHSQHFLTMPQSRTDPKWARFPGSTLPWSRCFAESGAKLTCLSCHDPHRDADPSPASYESRCLSCHATPSPRPGTATGAVEARSAGTACPVNPKADCIGCHMPKVHYDYLHTDFTDHYIRVHK